MKIGRYLLKDEMTPEDNITRLNWEADPNNNVLVKWDWPRNSQLTIALVFALDEEDTAAPLNELLKKCMPTLITKGLDKHYFKPIEGRQKIYKIYPAKLGEDTDIVVLNQQQGNMTDVLFYKINVYYKIDYKPIMMSKYQKVSINLEADNPISWQEALAYAKYCNNLSVCMYPLDESASENFFYIKKEEHIKMVVLDAFKNVLILHQKGRGVEV